MRPLLLLFVAAALAATGLGLAAAPDAKASSKKMTNPVPRDAAAIEEGKKLYARHCRSCHGPEGKGDGGMAVGGGTPANLTDETWDHGATDGEIFTVIKEGLSADMTGYQDELSDEQIWKLVHFIRTLGPPPPR